MMLRSGSAGGCSFRTEDYETDREDEDEDGDGDAGSAPPTVGLICVFVFQNYNVCFMSSLGMELYFTCTPIPNT